MDKDTKDIIVGVGSLVGTVALVAGLLWGVERWTDNRKMRENVRTILDVNEDNKLSNEETRRFYDETGLDIYSHPLKRLSRRDMKPFLGNYEQVWVRKSLEE